MVRSMLDLSLVFVCFVLCLTSDSFYWEVRALPDGKSLRELYLVAFTTPVFTLLSFSPTITIQLHILFLPVFDCAIFRVESFQLYNLMQFTKGAVSPFTPYCIFPLAMGGVLHPIGLMVVKPPPF